jgi:hypothetical protein
MFCVRYVKSQLYEISSVNFTVMVAAAATLAVSAAIAGIIPARRAASINPVEALRVGWTASKSDLSQGGNPLHPDGLEAFFAALRGQGFSVHEIEQTAKVNPAKLLGLVLLR